MNGLHDMGGWHGFGAVQAEADEPVFHERWEGRVFALMTMLGGRNIDQSRHAVERLDPVAYLVASMGSGASSTAAAPPR